MATTGTVGKIVAGTIDKIAIHCLWEKIATAGTAGKIVTGTIGKISHVVKHPTVMFKCFVLFDVDIKCFTL